MDEKTTIESNIGTDPTRAKDESDADSDVGSKEVSKTEEEFASSGKPEKQPKDEPQNEPCKVSDDETESGDGQETEQKSEPGKEPDKDSDDGIESVDGQEAEQKKKGRKKKRKKKKSGIRKVVNAIEWIILLVSVGLLAYIFITTMQGKAASFFGYRILYVVTGSMEPTISVNDYVVVKNADIASLQKGDIIAFFSEDPEIKGKMVIHRILDIQEDGNFIMKGDANPVEDSLPVRPDQVVGKYAGRLRFLNWLSSFVSLKKILLLLVIIPMFLMSIYEVSTLARLFKKKPKKQSQDGEPEGASDKRKGASSKKGDGSSSKKDDGTSTQTAESLEERIERLKREAVEEYLKSQKDNDVILSEAKNPDPTEQDDDEVILSDADEVVITAQEDDEHVEENQK